MTTATADDPAKIQKIEFITGGDRRGNIADKTLQRPTTTKHAYEHVTQIDLRQPTRR